MGGAAAVTFGALYLTCLIAVLLFPNGTVDFFNTWVHGLDLTLIRRPLNQPLGVGEFVSGFITVVLVSFVFGTLFGWTYDRIARQR